MNTDTVHSRERERKVEDCVIVPYAKAAEPITRFLARNGVRVIYSFGRKVMDYVAGSTRFRVGDAP